MASLLCHWRRGCDQHSGAGGLREGPRCPAALGTGLCRLLHFGKDAVVGTTQRRMCHSLWTESSAPPGGGAKPAGMSPHPVAVGSNPTGPNTTSFPNVLLSQGFKSLTTVPNSRQLFQPKTGIQLHYCHSVPFQSWLVSKSCWPTSRHPSSTPFPWTWPLSPALHSPGRQPFGEPSGGRPLPLP